MNEKDIYGILSARSCLEKHRLSFNIAIAGLLYSSEGVPVPLYVISANWGANFFVYL